MERHAPVLHVPLEEKVLALELAHMQLGLRVLLIFIMNEFLANIPEPLLFAKLCASSGGGEWRNLYSNEEEQV